MDRSDTGRNEIAAGIDAASVLPEIQITRRTYEDNMDEADVQTIIQQAIHEYMARITGGKFVAVQTDRNGRLNRFRNA